MITIPILKHSQYSLRSKINQAKVMTDYGNLFNFWHYRQCFFIAGNFLGEYFYLIRMTEANSIASCLIAITLNQYNLFLYLMNINVNSNICLYFNQIESSNTCQLTADELIYKICVDLWFIKTSILIVWYYIDLQFNY